MKSLIAILLLIILSPLLLLAQSRISGTLTDKESKQPVEYASVYIDGTTNGTLSDSLGNFHLHNVHFPCFLVVSHLSYKTLSLELENTDVSPLTIPLKLKVNEIKEISVQDKNLRKDNLTTFKDKFLGTNLWGKNATIENEEVIQFSRDYQPTRVIKKNNKTLTPDMLADPNLQWSADSTTVTYMAPYNLKANSLQPLKIDLSLLGYTLYYDLVGFVSEYQKELDGNLYTMLGFSYYVPIPYKSKRDSIRIEKNRLKAYYNSPQHFCKSLIENKLLQNGYQLFDPQPKDTISAYSNLLYSGEADSGNKKSLPVKKEPKGKKAMKEVWLDSCVHTLGDYAIVTGLKGRKFIIIYYSTKNNQPKDLTLFKGTMGLASEIIFGKDTCIIRKDGTVPDNSIIFGKEIGEKKVGAMLPGDYNPAH